MNYISSTISFDHSTDEQFPFSALTPPYQQQQQNQQIDDQLDELLMILAASPDRNFNGFPVLGTDDGGQQRKQQQLGGKSSDSGLNPSSGGDNKKRKVVHRDVERQRRHEMASLYGSLRSHLPAELLKGKRSISDHIHEAVRYIKHLQNKIQGLSHKKDKLKSLSEQSSDNFHPKACPPENPQSGCRDSIVTVNPCMTGVEITIHTDFNQGISLARVLGFLSLEGLMAISCTSTKVKEKMLHSIIAEVTDREKSGNQSELQQRIMSFLGKC